VGHLASKRDIVPSAAAAALTGQMQLSAEDLPPAIADDLETPPIAEQKGFNRAYPLSRLFERKSPADPFSIVVYESFCRSMDRHEKKT